ncbi:capsule assembly Wzi family protein [Dyadobacter tibetensis]|uniref:capsule assembly Wzi family protein n=1 Tax=Dyadobacter tibetensis TaxID=1211851 RepID=UPI00046F5EF8|nr:capsule assembly Wzi family protein [Dyadobacter tibetensis]
MRLILIVTISIFCLTAYGQDSTFHYSGGVQAAFSNSQTPFWLRVNQHGSVPTDGSFISASARIAKVYHPHNPRFLQWSGAVEAIGNVSQRKDFFFRDLFLAAKAGPVEISVGQRREFIGLADSLLSTGSFAMAPNYRPYPKIQISTPQFTNLIPGNDIIAFKFSYSDGLLGSAKVHYGNTNWVPEVYMHHKSLYLRLGRLSQKLNFYGGANHQAMWGGEQKIFSGGLKPSLAYEYVVLGRLWALSRVGNHFGSIDLAAEWKGKSWDIFVYRQNLYDDGSLSKLSNIADGLNGIRFTRKNNSIPPSSALLLRTILLEYAYTKSQGGSIFDFKTHTFGRDNYFNHYVYDQGWSYRGHSFGSPLIGPQALNRDELKGDSTIYTMNSRVLALHCGLAGSWKKMNFSLKATFTHNEGTYNDPFDKPIIQSNILLQSEKKISTKGNHLLSLSIAADIGKLYPNTGAIMVGWKSYGFLK